MNGVTLYNIFQLDSSGIVVDWLDNFICDAWLPLSLQSGLLRIADLLRLLREHVLRQVPPEQGFRGSLETILEEREPPPRESVSTQTLVEIQLHNQVTITIHNHNHIRRKEATA